VVRKRRVLGLAVKLFVGSAALFLALHFALLAVLVAGNAAPSEVISGEPVTYNREIWYLGPQNWGEILLQLLCWGAICLAVAWCWMRLRTMTKWP
jgi:hypothetical protein